MAQIWDSFTEEGFRGYLLEIMPVQLTRRDSDYWYGAQLMGHARFVSIPGPILFAFSMYLDDCITDQEEQEIIDQVREGKYDLALFLWAKHGWPKGMLQYLVERRDYHRKLEMFTQAMRLAMKSIETTAHTASRNLTDAFRNVGLSAKEFSEQVGRLLNHPLRGLTGVEENPPVENSPLPLPGGGSPDAGPGGV